jgi:hypothetical protein
MLAKLRPRSVYDVMAALALFLVVAGGTAYATHELILSSDIVDGEVKTPDIADAAVVTDKLAQGAVTTGKVKNNDLTGGDIADESLTGLDVVDNDSLKGVEIDESTLGLVPAAVLGGYGRSVGGPGGCNPQTESGPEWVDCGGFVRLNLPTVGRAGIRVLMIGAVRGVNDPMAPVDFGDGQCRLFTSPPGGPGTPLLESPASYSIEFGRGGEENGTMVAVTPPLGPGTTDFGMECRETFGNILFRRANLTAVAISPN